MSLFRYLNVREKTGIERSETLSEKFARGAEAGNETLNRLLLR